MLQRHICAPASSRGISVAPKEAFPYSLKDPIFKEFCCPDIRRDDSQKSGNAPTFENVSQYLYKEEHAERALHMLVRMDKLVAPNCDYFWVILNTCNKTKALNHAQKVHSCMIYYGVDLFTSLGEYLIAALIKCDGLKYALHVFKKLPHPTVFSWTSIISGFIDSGENKEALRLYQHMQNNGVEPNKYTFVLLLKACGSVSDLEKGKKLHADVRRQGGFDSNTFVRSSLVTMYGNCGSLTDSEIVFYNGPVTSDTVLWSTMLSVYVEHGQGKKSIQLYRQMQEEGIVPDEQCLVIALQACCVLFQDMVVEGSQACLQIGQAIHAEARRKGLLSNIFVGSTLISMYGKLGNIIGAENVFVQLPRQSIGPWNAMLSAYIELGLPGKALCFYCHIRKNGFSPDKHTVAITLQACCIFVEMHEGIGNSAQIMCLEIGQALYLNCQMKGFISDAVICSSFMSLFSKCGSIIGAESIFYSFSGCDTVLWNMMLSTYSNDGQAAKALQLCKKILDESLLLSDATVIHMLQISGKTGSISMCTETHNIIESNSCDFGPHLANTLAHAYGNCASMINAQSVFEKLVNPNIVSWNGLLAGYAHEGDYTASLRTLEEMELSGITPDEYTFLSILAACTHAGLVNMGIRIFEHMCNYYAIAPEIKHYICIIDLLGRAGDFNRAEDILQSMPTQADVATWSCLVRACRTHDNIDLEKHALDLAVCLQS